MNLKASFFDGMRQDVCAFMREEDAISVVEIVFIIAVLIGVVIIFRDQISKLVKKMLKKVTEKGDTVLQ